MGITTNTKFRILVGDGAEMDVWISGNEKGKSIISISMKKMEDLGIIIHELCEIEVNYLLLTEFISMSHRFVDCTEKLFSMLEDLDKRHLGDHISVAHLASPYGYNCLIGKRDSPKW